MDYTTQLKELLSRMDYESLQKVDEIVQTTRHEKRTGYIQDRLDQALIDHTELSTCVKSNNIEYTCSDRLYIAREETCIDVHRHNEFGFTIRVSRTPDKTIYIRIRDLSFAIMPRYNIHDVIDDHWPRIVTWTNNAVPRAFLLKLIANAFFT